MSQTFTDDCYGAGHQAITDLQAYENNFAALKSAFSGTSAPSNLVPGMAWLDTTLSLLKTRNGANDAWNIICRIVATSIASGDMIYASAANVLSLLAKGTAYQTLNMNSGATAPQWMASLQSVLTTKGDLIYASAANTPARVPIGTAKQMMVVNATADGFTYQEQLTAVAGFSVPIIQSDAEVSNATDTITTVKQATINVTGNVYWGFDYCGGTAYFGGVFWGYKNGVEVFRLDTTSESTYANTYRTYAVVPGDIFRLDMATNHPTYPVKVKNFRITCGNTNIGTLTVGT